MSGLKKSGFFYKKRKRKNMKQTNKQTKKIMLPLLPRETFLTSVERVFLYFKNIVNIVSAYILKQMF